MNEKLLRAAILLFEAETNMQVPEAFAPWLAAFAAQGPAERRQRMAPVLADAKAVAAARRDHWAALVRDLEEEAG